MEKIVSAYVKVRCVAFSLGPSPAAAGHLCKHSSDLAAQHQRDCPAKQQLAACSLWQCCTAAHG